MAETPSWLSQYTEVKDDSWLDQYKEVKEKPFLDISETASALGRAATSLPTTTMASLSQAWEGLDNPWKRSEGYLARRQEMQALQDELAKEEEEAAASGDISTVSSTIREATPSLGFSGATLIPSMGAAAGTLALSKSPMAARGAAAATSALMAYRMAGAQFLDDAKDRIDSFFAENLNREPTEQEKEEAYQELLPLARKFGAAEAGPEALGNLALGGAGKYIRRALGGKNGVMELASNALGKVTGTKATLAGAGALTSEIGTEAVTGVEQQRIQKQFEEGVMRGESPESVPLEERTLDDYIKSFKEVAPATMAMTGMMGAAGLGPTTIARGIKALRPTPPERQTQIQKDLQAEAGAIPQDTVPDQTNEEKLAAMEAGGTTVVDPDGKTAVIPPQQPELPSMPDPDEVAVQLNTDAAKSLEAAGSSESAKAQAGFDATLKEILPKTSQPTIPTLEEAEKAEPEVTPPSAVKEEIRMPSPKMGEPVTDEEDQGAVSMPMMVTRDMKQQLVDLGYSKTDINSMRPEEAAAIIKSVIYKAFGNARRAGEKFMETMPNGKYRVILPDGRVGVTSKSSGDTKFVIGRDGKYLATVDASVLFPHRYTHLDGREEIIQPWKFELIQAYSDVTPSTPPSPTMEQATAPAVEEPTLTPEPELYAPNQVPSEESVYEEPQDRVKGREAKEASLGDSLLPSKEGKVEEEVMPLPEVAADPFAAAPLVDNLPALIAVRDNNATPEQVQSLVDQGLVEQVDGQNIITEAGVAAMPEDQRPKLTPTERAAEVEGMAAPVAQEGVGKILRVAHETDTMPLKDIVSWAETQGVQRSEALDYANELTKSWAKKVVDRANAIFNRTVELGFFPAKISKDGKRIVATGGGFNRGNRVEVDHYKSPIHAAWVAAHEFSHSLFPTSLIKEDIPVALRNKFDGEVPAGLGSAKKSLQERVAVDFANWLSPQIFPEHAGLFPQVNTDVASFFEASRKDRPVPLPRPQLTAAEKPTPDSVAVEPGATRGVQPEPPRGSILEVDKVSPETEISSRENLGPEVAAAEKKQAAADEAAKKRQKKQDESTKNSLNSILDPQKKNAVTGTVTKADVETAREALTNSGEIPNAYLTNVYESVEAFLADKANARLFPSAYARLQTEKNIEGLYENGQTLIFAKQIQVSNLDRNLAKMLGITPEQAAARRVIAHENGHKAISLFTMAEKRELRGYLMRAYSDEQIAKLVETYDEYADWRTNLESRFEALEELLMRDFEKMDKIPTGGVWDDIVQFLKRVWRRLTGQKGEPTLKNLKDVARLMRNAMKRPAVPLGSFTLKDGGKVKLSFIGEKAIENLPTPTPVIDIRKLNAEYLAAVEQGDRGNDNLNQLLRDASPNERQTVVDSWIERNPWTAYKIQWSVKEMAKARGYDIEAYHGSSAENDFTVFDAEKILNEGAGVGFYFALDKRLAQEYANKYPKGKVFHVFLKQSTPLKTDVEYPSTPSNDLEAFNNTVEAITKYGQLSSFERQALKESLSQLGAAPNLLSDPSYFQTGLRAFFKSKEFQNFNSRSKAYLLSLYEILAGKNGKQWSLDTIGLLTRMDGLRFTDPGVFTVLRPNQIKSADPVTFDNAGNVIPPSQRFQPTSPDIRFSRPQFASDTDAATSAGNEAARSTIYSERDMDVREAIRRAYEAMPKDTSVAVPIGELFAKTEELLPDVTQDEFSNVLQDLFEDNGAVLQEGEVVEPLTEQDRRYLALAEDEEANQEELQRMVDEAAKAAGYNRKGVRFGFYVDGVPLPPSRHGELNFGPGYYVAEDATLDTTTASAVSVSPKVNTTDLKSLGIDPERVEFRRDAVFVKANRPFRSEYGTNAEPETVAFINAQLAYDSAVQEANRKLGLPFETTSYGKTVSDLIAQGRIPFDSWRGQTGRKGMSSELVVQNPSQIKSADPVTRDDQGRIIPLSRRFDTGADIRGQINVTTPEGRRAGFVVVMPRAAKASRIRVEDAEEAAPTFKSNIDIASKGRVETDEWTGKNIKGVEVPEHNINAPELYMKAAIDLIKNFQGKGYSLIEISESLQDREFEKEIGLKDYDVDVIQKTRKALGFEVQMRMQNARKKTKIEREKLLLDKAIQNLGVYMASSATGEAQVLQEYQFYQNNPRYRFMVLENAAKKDMLKNAGEIVDAATGSADKIVDLVNTENKNATDAAVQQLQEEDVSTAEDDLDAQLILEGEALLDPERRKIWDRIKDILRKLALIARARSKRVPSAAKASISKAESDAIFKMSDDELTKLEKELLGEFNKLAKAFLGEETKAKTPEQKKTRQKREKMVNTAQKRVEAGKDIDVKGRIESLFPLADTRSEIIDEVGNALLKAAEQRKVKPKQRTAIQDFVSAIKQTLMANIKGDKLNADQPSLGMLLAKTFAQQGSEAKAFAESWANGRKKVREMLIEMGIEQENLNAELDAIMPPTPTLAYAPAAARRAVSNAMREIGLMRYDLLNDPVGSKKAIMDKFDEAAKDANLTEEGWDQKGRDLAEKAVDESIVEAKIAQERAKKVAKILSEQADKPVSLEEFGVKLAEFRFKKDKIVELFKRAKKLAEKKVQMANDQAIRVLFAAENKLAQSAFFNDAEKPDTIVKAFREQVEEPMDRDAFKKRMEKMLVTPEMADRLFDKAARERDNARWKKAQDFLEGPKARQNLLREMNKARPAGKTPLEQSIPWKTILSQNPETFEQYRQRIFDAISSIEDLQGITEEQKERLAELYAEALQEKRDTILDSLIRKAVQEKRRENLLGEQAEKAIIESTNKIIDLVNLGGFNRDDVIRVLGEKFGLKTDFTEAEKEKIQDLAEKLQNENLNPAKRNKLAMEFLIVIAGASDIPVTQILANFWTSNILFGPQTIFSIASAFLNGAYGITTIGLARGFRSLTKGDIKGAIEESLATLDGIGRYLSAFPSSFNRAWQYLWSGDIAFLSSGANDVLSQVKTLEDLRNFKNYKMLAENLAKDPSTIRRYVGLYLRFVSRLLTALDAFNIMVTQAGHTSIALRQAGLTTEKIKEAEMALDLEPYKKKIIEEEFEGKKPTTLEGKALLRSLAEAEMVRALNELGAKMENADWAASESAMTMNPTGFGGGIYKAFTGTDKKLRNVADDFLNKTKKKWVSEKDLFNGLELALAYFVHFAAYQAANVAGYKFIRYASNKFNQGISYLPVIGLLRNYEKGNQNIKGKEAFMDSLYRNQMVSFALGVVGYFVLKAITDEPDDEKRNFIWNGGWDNLTPDQIKQKLSSGEKPYTIVIKYNGKGYVFNYQNWPWNQIGAAIGAMSDQIRFSPNQWNEKGIVNKMLSAVVSGTSAALEMPAVSQLAEVFGTKSIASKDPTEQALNKFNRIVSGWTGGFTPRMLKDFDFFTEPSLRKYEGLWEKTASQIPIYRRYVGEEYYDILGKQIEKNVIPGSREFMMKRTDPEYKILGALNARNIWLTPANAEYRMVGKGRNRRRLTQEEADAYSLETGRGYRDMLLRYGQRALQMPTERARAFLQDKAEEVRDRALKRAYRR